jgi:HSP20 family protein
MSVIRWDPFRELHALQRRVNRLFEEASRRRTQPEFGASWSPDVDIYETEAEIVIQAELPGLDRRHISLNLDGQVLTLSGNRPMERDNREENYQRIECSYGPFSRSFTLPAGVRGDRARADYTDGVLTIELPRTRNPESRRIRITS